MMMMMTLNTVGLHYNFCQIFNDDRITSVCVCTSDCEHSTRTSFTRTYEKPVLGNVLVLMSMWMQRTTYPCNQSGVVR